ncbi:Rho guanine nucleotide exchange factor 7 [Blattella germanica]|nr:Rho guanine nucleotide exchange factor 7 [Blattella germanica]
MLTECLEEEYQEQFLVTTLKEKDHWDILGKDGVRIFTALLDSPQMLIAEEEKIIIEETSGNQIIVEEKSLVDTVYALKDQVKDLRSNVMQLTSQLEEETKARLCLQNIVRTHLKNIEKEDIQWPEN